MGNPTLTPSTPEPCSELGPWFLQFKAKLVWAISCCNANEIFILLPQSPFTVIFGGRSELGNQVLVTAMQDTNIFYGFQVIVVKIPHQSSVARFLIPLPAQKIRISKASARDPAKHHIHPFIHSSICVCKIHLFESQLHNERETHIHIQMFRLLIYSPDGQSWARLKPAASFILLPCE